MRWKRDLYLLISVSNCINTNGWHAFLPIRTYTLANAHNRDDAIRSRPNAILHIYYSPLHITDIHAQLIHTQKHPYLRTHRSNIRKYTLTCLVSAGLQDFQRMLNVMRNTKYSLASCTTTRFHEILFLSASVITEMLISLLMTTCDDCLDNDHSSPVSGSHFELPVFLNSVLCVWMS